MKGINVPAQMEYDGDYQVAFYEGRQQPYTIWTTTYPQRVVYFARSKVETVQWITRHPRAVA